MAEVFNDMPLNLRAIELRKLGLSLKDISEAIGINKKKITKWIKGVNAIDPTCQSKFEGLGSIVASKNRTLARLKRENSFLKEADVLFEQYKNDPLFMLGLGLYWGEGAKTNKQFNLSNADLNLIKCWLSWCNKFAKNVLLHYTVYGHEDVVQQEAFKFWGQNLGISIDKFVLSVPNSSKNKRPKRILPYGTLRIVGGTDGTEMHHKMMRWLEILRNL